MVVLGQRAGTVAFVPVEIGQHDVRVRSRGRSLDRRRQVLGGGARLLREPQVLAEPRAVGEPVVARELQRPVDRFQPLGHGACAEGGRERSGRGGVEAREVQTDERRVRAGPDGRQSLASRAHGRQRLIEGPVADGEIRSGVADPRLAGPGDSDEPLRIALEQQREIPREQRL